MFTVMSDVKKIKKLEEIEGVKLKIKLSTLVSQYSVTEPN